MSSNHGLSRFYSLKADGTKLVRSPSPVQSRKLTPEDTVYPFGRKSSYFLKASIRGQFQYALAVCVHNNCPTKGSPNSNFVDLAGNVFKSYVQLEADHFNEEKLVEAISKFWRDYLSVDV